MKTSMMSWFVFAVLSIQTSFSQIETDPLVNAFIESYSKEKNGDYVKAIAALKNVYQSDSYEMNLRLGWLYYSSGNYTESIQFYNRSIQLMPLSVEARMGYVLPASAMGNWTQVIRQYEDILKIDDKNSTANYRLASIYYSRKNFTSAYAHLEKVVNLYPFDYDSTILYAWTNYQLGKLREAKVLFQKVLLIAPGDSSAKEGLTLIK